MSIFKILILIYKIYYEFWQKRQDIDIYAKMIISKSLTKCRTKFYTYGKNS